MRDFQGKGAERNRTAVCDQWDDLQQKDRTDRRAHARVTEERRYGPHWKKLRARLLEERDYTCDGCGKRSYYALHIHHLTYERFGEELDSDLVVLCRKCHVNAHFWPDLVEANAQSRGRRVNAAPLRTPEPSRTEAICIESQ